MTKVRSVEVGTAIKISGNGEVVLTVKPQDGKKFSLEELQKIVGGYIEIIPQAKGYKGTMYGNEEARLLNMRPNRTANARKNPDTLGYVSGDVIIVQKVKA